MNAQGCVAQLSEIIEKQKSIIDALEHGQVVTRSREKLIDTTGELENLVEELELELKEGG